MTPMNNYDLGGSDEDDSNEDDLDEDDCLREHHLHDDFDMYVINSVDKF